MIDKIKSEQLHKSMSDRATRSLTCALQAGGTPSSWCNAQEAPKVRGMSSRIPIAENLGQHIDETDSNCQTDWRWRNRYPLCQKRAIPVQAPQRCKHVLGGHGSRQQRARQHAYVVIVEVRKALMMATRISDELVIRSWLYCG